MVHLQHRRQKKISHVMQALRGGERKKEQQHAPLAGHTSHFCHLFGWTEEERFLQSFIKRMVCFRALVNRWH